MQWSAVCVRHSRWIQPDRVVTCQFVSLSCSTLAPADADSCMFHGPQRSGPANVQDRPQWSHLDSMKACLAWVTSRVAWSPPTALQKGQGAGSAMFHRRPTLPIGHISRSANIGCVNSGVLLTDRSSSPFSPGRRAQKSGSTPPIRRTTLSPGQEGSLNRCGFQWGVTEPTPRSSCKVGRKP